MKKIIPFLIIVLFLISTVYAEDIEIIQDSISLPNVEIIQPTPAPTPRPVIAVKIHWREVPNPLMEGTALQLVSELKNCETAQSITYQWQIDRKDGRGFIDIDGATGDSITVYATNEQRDYEWRLKVTVEW